MICCLSRLGGVGYAHSIAIQQLPFLKPFSLNQYKQCAYEIVQCKSSSSSHTCLDQLSQTLICSQFNTIAHHLQTSMVYLKIQAVGNIYLVTQSFPADGQQGYFVINIQNQLFDLLKFRPNLKQHLVIFQSAPHIQIKNQATYLQFPIIEKACMACANIASYKLGVYFNKQGHLMAYQ